MADLGALWRRLLHRPRIALETAYLGAAAGLVGFYLPTPLPELAHRVPAMVQPLSDSAQQAAKKVVQAECRTALSLGRRLEPLVKPRLDPQAARTLWRQAAYRTRAWLRRFRPPPSPTPKPPSETPPPANPG